MNDKRHTAGAKHRTGHPMRRLSPPFLGLVGSGRRSWRLCLIMCLWASIDDDHVGGHSPLTGHGLKDRVRGLFDQSPTMA